MIASCRNLKNDFIQINIKLEGNLLLSNLKEILQVLDFMTTTICIVPRDKIKEPAQIHDMMQSYRTL